MKHILALLAVLLLTPVTALPATEDIPSGVSSDKADLDQLVAGTHNASLKLREEALRKTIAKDTAWPPGIWGDNLWTLSALYLNEKVEAANARLLKQAKDYIASGHPQTQRLTGRDYRAEQSKDHRQGLGLARGHLGRQPLDPLGPLSE